MDRGLSRLHPRAHEAITDPEAWEGFQRALDEGAGSSDDLRPPRADLPLAERRFLSELVSHHRENTIPFLIGHCGLAGQHVLEVGAGTGALAVAMLQAGVGSVE